MSPSLLVGHSTKMTSHKCTQQSTGRNTHTQRSVISLWGCRLWVCRGQWGGIGISAVFGVLQLISLDFSETAAHPDLIQSLTSPLPPSNCFCLFINSTCYLQRSRRRAAKYSQRGGSGGGVVAEWWSLYSQTPNLTGTLGSPVLFLPPPTPFLSFSLRVSCLCFCLKNINQGPSLNRRQTASPPPLLKSGRDSWAASWVRLASPPGWELRDDHQSKPPAHIVK